MCINTHPSPHTQHKNHTNIKGPVACLIHLASAAQRLLFSLILDSPYHSVGVQWILHLSIHILKVIPSLRTKLITNAKLFLNYPRPSHFIQATGEVIQEWMYPLCIWEWSQQPGLRKEQYPSGLLAAKRLCPHPPAFQHQGEHAILNLCTLRVNLSGSTACVKLGTFGEWE